MHGAEKNVRRARRVAIWCMGFVLLGLAAAGCASPAPTFPPLRPGLLRETGELRIPGREQFQIGPATTASFSLQVQNRGSVPVRFSVRAPDGEANGWVVIAPGSFLNPTVPAGSVAVFRNATRMRTASLIVRVDADATVPMRFQ